MDNQDEVKKRKKRLWWILLLLFFLIIAVLLYLFLVYFKNPTINNTNYTPNLNQEPIVNAPLPTAPTKFNQVDSGVLSDLIGLNGQQVKENETEKQAAQVIATSFAERFGSYSNQSNYTNFDDLAGFMTPSMNNWVTRYKEDLKKQNPDFNTYYALETKAISTQINIMDEKTGKSEILVKTQRQEFKNTITNPRVFYQDILLKLTKVNDDWKVEGAYWQ